MSIFLVEVRGFKDEQKVKQNFQGIATPTQYLLLSLAGTVIRLYVSDL